MILVKTEAGQQVLRDRSVPLTRRQRSAFILFDGKRSIGDVLATGTGFAQEDIDQLVELGLLGQVAVALSTAANASSLAPQQTAAALLASAVSDAARNAHQCYQKAYPIATKLTASLGLRGLRLNIAVEATTGHQQLAALAPKIRAVLGAEKAAAFEHALDG